MKEVTASELKEMRESKADFQLIDVREPHEKDMADIGGELIPLGTILDNVEQISKDKKVVVYCRSGKRSATAIMQLEKKHGFTNLWNLTGGVLGYAEVDETIEPY
jgi:rhodanese-related sulfurtransferase